MNLNIHQKHCKSSRVHKLRLQAARAQSKNRAAEIVKNSFRPIFGFYPDNHIDELRERSFRLLETHGVAIEHEEAVKLLTAAGATQTSDGKCYRPPRQLIKEALATDTEDCRVVRPAPPVPHPSPCLGSPSWRQQRFSPWWSWRTCLEPTYR